MGQIDEQQEDVIEESAASPRTEQWRQYLSLIRDTQLLTEKEENALGQLIQAGHRATLQLNELEKRSDTDTMSSDYQLLEREVKATIRSADKAKRELVEHNLRLAAHIALQFRGRGIATMDLIQDANVALMKAAENWDYGTGKRFGFVAQLYVKRALTNSCYQVNGIHAPTDVLRAIQKIERVSQTVLRTLGYSNDFTTARELNVPILTIKQLRSAARSTAAPISLDAPIDDDGERTLTDTIPTPAESSPEVIVCDIILHERMTAMLSTLEPIEEKVIRLRFGFEDGATHSQEDVGRLCGTSCEVIQLAEAKAMRKLRHPSRSGQFTGLL